MPETFFFVYHRRRYDRLLAQRPVPEVVKSLLRESEIEPCGVNAEEVLSHLPGSPNVADLFSALAAAYGERHGKARVGEKSCGHLFVTERLLRTYPGCRVVCILRDGRDVVHSLQNAWEHRVLPLDVACAEWLRSTRALKRLADRVSASRLLVVRFEDLVRQPRETLSQVCDFLDEELEPRQLRSGVDSAVIPDHERGWKEKAEESPDAARAEAWKARHETGSAATRRELRRMTHLMRPMLDHWGYEIPAQLEASTLEKTAWSLRFLPYSRPLHLVTRTAYRMIRRLLRVDLLHGRYRFRPRATEE